MKLTKILTLLLVLSVYQNASAFIPSAKSLLLKVASHGGQGLYRIDQELILVGDGEAFEVMETWMVADGSTLKLTVSGKKGLKDNFQTQILYRDGKRYTIEEGQRSVSPVSSEFYESLLLYRSRLGLAQALIQMKLSPPTILKERVFVKTSKGFEYTPEPYIQLARIGAVPTWAIAPSARADSSSVWIDPDKFFILKVMGDKDSHLLAQEYQEYPKNLSYPAYKIIQWGDHAAHIRVMRIQFLGSGGEKSETFDPAGIDARRIKAKWPEARVVRDFYSRFR